MDTAFSIKTSRAYALGITAGMALAVDPDRPGWPHYVAMAALSNGESDERVEELARQWLRGIERGQRAVATEGR